MKRLIAVNKTTFAVLISVIGLISCSPDKASVESKLLSTSIMNGKAVAEKDALAASVVGIYNTKEKFICTGSLIASNIVLTAAHCMPKRASDVKIVFATNIDYIMNTREMDILQEHALSATDFRVSPVWNPKNETVEVDTGDIAIIKFKGVIPPGYKPATFLANKDDLKVGTLVTLAGYGVDSVEMTEIDPKKYRKLEEAIEFGDVVCSGDRKNYGTCFEIERSGDGELRTTTAPVSFIHETEIRLNEKQSGTCNGDSGGPAYLLKDGVYYLFGVTSRGSELCNEVGVYTNALAWKTWIDETIASLNK